MPDNRDPPPGFTGLWTRESPDGVRVEWTYINGERQGSFRQFNRHGVVVRECEMNGGQYHGTMIVRDSKGAELDRSEFVDGTGVYRIFTTNGRLGWEIPLRQGKKHGVVRRRLRGRWVEEEWRDGESVS